MSDVKQVGKECAIGGVAGAFAKTAFAPLDNVKLLISLRGEYRGIVDCVKRVSTTEGPSRLWRGNAANLRRYSPLQALNFGFRDLYRSVLERTNNSLHSTTITWISFVSGGLAGATSCALMYPLDVARARLLNAKTRDQGVALYKGFAITATGVSIYRSVYFGLYDSLRPRLPLQHSFAIHVLLGWIVTFIAGVSSYPFDTIRRRMQQSRDHSFRTSFDCASQIVKREGLAALMRGWQANVLRSLVGGTVLACADTLRWASTVLND